ncbi:MAG: Na+/H+ antiporter subunit D, partial [Verrucomicrobiota bacterium]
MNDYSILYPILLPLIGAFILLMGHRSLALQRAGAVVFSCLTFAASIYLLILTDQRDYIVMQVGDWAAPFGISLVADRFAAVMVAVSSFMGAAVAIYAQSEIDDARLEKFFFPLYLI